VGEDWLLRRRVEAEEWLDQGIGRPAAIEQSLADLNRINLWLGGVRSLCRHLFPRLGRWPSDVLRILDLGAGGCAMAQTLARWGRAHRRPLQVVALDMRLPHLQWAHRQTAMWPEIALVQGDAWMPPIAEGSVDAVISSLFLHHFTPADLIQLLPRWVRLARRSVIMSDLVRHPLPYWFIKVTSPVFARSAITRHDAAISLRRAYTPNELRTIVEQAGLHGAHLYSHFPYRMTLVIDGVEATQT
jgi:2-polyprenyl-3-methyl-5-hydroxy-6-metoxy-1,4-benzoquinol methylase